MSRVCKREGGAYYLPVGLAPGGVDGYKVFSGGDNRRIRKSSWLVGKNNWFFGKIHRIAVAHHGLA